MKEQEHFKMAWKSHQRVRTNIEFLVLTFFAQEALPQTEAKGHDQQSRHCGDWDQDGEGLPN